MKIQILAGTPFISIDENGDIKTHAITPHVHFDVCPTWLKIATHHSKDANERKLARVAAWNSTDEGAKAETLKWEFEASMQAIRGCEGFSAASYVKGQRVLDDGKDHRPSENSRSDR